MGERLLQGAPASPGLAVGSVWRRTSAAIGERTAPEDRERELETALAALQQAAHGLEALAATMSGEEAEILEAGALMASDPALSSAVQQGVLARGLSAGDAILEATGDLAATIAAIDDATLAARADDVRSLGRRAARLTAHAHVDAPPEGAVLIDRDVGPADVAELAPALAGVALVGGGATAHAAIVARSLGVPMVTGLPEQALALGDGIPVALDGAAGTICIEPNPDRATLAAGEMAARRAGEERAAALRDQPAVTTDGTRITVLANVASVAELELALSAGAEGVGLLRTELAFLDATDWPREDQHVEALAPVIAAAGRRPVIVRVLDIGPDKCPPFARGLDERGITLLLAHEDALLAQLHAIVDCARGHDVRVLLPMVDAPEQVARVRELIAGELPLGAMIETAEAARRSPDLARVSDFLSIGTNDLTASVLGVDRFATGSAHAHDPAVLRLIARAVAAARDAGVAIEVCGEAASDPETLPLLVGLGIEELSVGAARVGEVRRWIRELGFRDAQRRVLSVQPGDSGAERGQRGRGVHALGA